MKKYKLLSLDIWDTVLRRKCHPDESKYFISRYILLKFYDLLKDEYKNYYDITNIRVMCELNLAKNAKKQLLDDEYDIREVFTELLSIIINQKNINMIDINSIVYELLKAELEHEKYVSYIDKGIISYIKDFKYDNLIYVSDFYADHNFINEILAHHNWPFDFSQGVVSSCYKLNKKSGRLFQKIHKDLSLSPNEHLHIGDNKKADVEIPRQIGINAIEYRSIEEKINRERHNRQYSLRTNNIKAYLENLYNELLNTPKYLSDRKKRNLYISGKQYSIVFFAFILWVIEDVIKQKGNTIYYFTREGEFFKAIHEIIEQHNPLGVPIPKAEILEVSRMATFSPSLKEVSIREFMRLWNQYGNQSIKALFKTLNINYDRFNKYFTFYNIQIDIEYKSIYENPNIKQLFSDDLFIEELLGEITNKRNKLKEYFFEKNISDLTKNLFVVDIGWRGSIQDNIANIYDSTNIVGYYVGLFDSFNPTLANNKKNGFISSLNSKNKLWIFNYVDPFEMMNNSPNGSTTGYDFLDGRITATRKKAHEEDFVYENYIKYFQEGILDSVFNICEFVRTYSFMFDDIKNEAYERLEELMTNPPRCLTQAYFKLSHNETFGLGRFISKTVRFSFINMVKSIFSKKARTEFIDYVESLHWPQGYFNYYGLSFLTKIYNKRVKLFYSMPLLLSGLDYSERIKMQLPQNTVRLIYYFDEFRSDFSVIEVRGWVVNPGLSSKDNKIFLVLINENSNSYIYQSKVEIRKDITAYFNDKINYDEAGFLVKIRKDELELGVYSIHIILNNNILYMTETDKLIKI